MQKWKIELRSAAVVVALSVVLVLPAGLSASGDSVAVMSAAGNSVAWTPLVGTEGFVLTVALPDGSDIRQEFGPGETPSFETSMDGAHTYELRGIPIIDEDVREMLAAARESGDQSVAARLRAEGRLPAGPIVQSGGFLVLNGSLVEPGQVEPETTGAEREAASAPAPVEANGAPDPVEQTIADDLCVGVGCPPTPTFGRFTILARENNTGLKFDDNSTLAGFPDNDWGLIANGENSGDPEFFAIQDCGNAEEGTCTGNIPFTIQAGAPSNALVLEASTGDVGFGTATPVFDLHVLTGDTPGLRLAQDNSSGFTPQTWDVFGNEGGFFISDVTNGSTPFGIFPGAASSSLVVAGDDSVGIGTSSPDASLEIARSNGTARLQITETSGTVTGRTLFDLFNNGNVQFFFSNTDSGDVWQMSAFSTAFQISSPSTGRGKFRVFKTGGLQALDGSDVIMALDNNGNLTVTSVTQTSSREAKSGFAPVDSAAVLEKVASLPLSTWSYKTGDPSVRHLGPMAEDFHAAFGLGKDATGLTSVDTAGVAFAAIQGLHSQLAAKDAHIQELEARLAKLEALVLATAGD